MNNNTIEFNKSYTKLPAGIKTARLVACEAVRLGAQIWEFIRFDTQLRSADGQLKYGDIFDEWSDDEGDDIDMLLLCLISDTGAFFTTLRKDNEENREKYMWAEFDDLTVLTPRYNRIFQIIIKEG